MTPSGTSPYKGFYVEVDPSAPPAPAAFLVQRTQFGVATMITPVLPTYARFPFAFERGEGVRAYTDQGEEYLDFGSGIAVNALGHVHPHLVAALTEQAVKLWHTSNLYGIPGQEKLARRLVDSTFADTVFFCNSGAEAIECSIKMARKYHTAEGNDARYRFITFEGAFHGRTLATLAAGGQQKHLEGFGPVVDGFDQVPFGISTRDRGDHRRDRGHPGGADPGRGRHQACQPQFLRALRAVR